MDRWWSDGTETGARLWQGIVAIVATGCLLGHRAKHPRSLR